MDRTETCRRWSVFWLLGVLDAAHELAHALERVELHRIEDTEAGVHTLHAAQPAKERTDDQVRHGARVRVLAVQPLEKRVEVCLEVVGCEYVVCRHISRAGKS